MESESDGGLRDVHLVSLGDKKLKIINEVREATGLGLKEATAVVVGDGSVARGIPQDEAETLGGRLEARGARVEITAAGVARTPAKPPRCPKCDSTNVEKITIAKKVKTLSSRGALGARTALRGYQCLNCKHKFES